MPGKETIIWDANSYSQHSAPQYRASKKLISNYPFKGHETILDIGCGPGLLTQEIADLAPRGKVVGIDSSSSMIHYAKKHSQKQNISYIEMDAQELSFPCKFNVIISTFCLQWAPDKKLAFRKIAAYLEENGTILLIMPFLNMETAKIRDRLMKQNDWISYFKNYNDPKKVLLDNDYKKYAQEAGFANIDYQLEVVTEKFANVADLTAYLRNIMGCLSQLPNETLKNSFMEELVLQYLNNHPPASDGSCEITYTYATLRANGVNKTYIKNNETDPSSPKTLSKL